MIEEGHKWEQVDTYCYLESSVVIKTKKSALFGILLWQTDVSTAANNHNNDKVNININNNLNHKSNDNSNSINNIIIFYNVNNSDNINFNNKINTNNISGSK